MQPHIFLTVIDEGPMDGLTYHLKNDISEYSLGRSDNNYFFFPFDKKMSKLHAKLMFSSKNSAGYIMDMDSEWGVWIDGVKLNPGKYYELKWGQILLLGSTIIKVCKQDNAICHSENSYEFFFRDPGFLYKFSDPIIIYLIKTDISISKRICLFPVSKGNRSFRIINAIFINFVIN